MKIILFLFAFLWAIAADSKPLVEPDSLLGSWKLDKITIKTDRESFEIPVAPAVPVSAKFAADGTYTFTENGQEQNGKWRWRKAKKRLEITHGDKSKRIFDITR